MRFPGMKIARHQKLEACAIILCVAGLLYAVPQQDQDSTRQLWDTAYINPAKATAKKRSRRSYRVVTPQVPTSDVSANSVIGITLWRLRPSQRADVGERIIAHEGPESVEWLPERISSTGRLAEGDRIRMSIEAARTGYLYVVDQEQYADGSKGEPYLIFPTTRTRAGDNAVKAGRVVEIPAQDDAPPYFTLKRSRTDHIGENVLVLVTPTPIDSLTITEKAQKLSDETIATWEKSWGAEAGRLEMVNGDDKPWTRAEKEAGGDGTRALNDEEPAPQTIYYQPKVSGAQPVLVKVEIQYARTIPKKRQ